ncbi:hypothetical protein AVEN_240260-1 [Araneus ventricosus]|uniref:Secreted protein n=1 Tax=Araneus ventricosus TaxID=182803 RepID=A0A4Y2VKT5_ARAVE|nr:hypothetical protein AVEN_240260-1 [Araneus ventricosus]
MWRSRRISELVLTSLLGIEMSGVRATPLLSRNVPPSEGVGPRSVMAIRTQYPRCPVADFRTGGRCDRLVPRDSRRASKSVQETSQR